MSLQSREQRLVDIMFRVAEVMSDPKNHGVFDRMKNAERMAWVATRLSQHGFQTKQAMGSWGVLVNNGEAEKPVFLRRVSDACVAVPETFNVSERVVRDLIARFLGLPTDGFRMYPRLKSDKTLAHLVIAPDVSCNSDRR